MFLSAERIAAVDFKTLEVSTGSLVSDQTNVSLKWQRCCITIPFLVGALELLEHFIVPYILGIKSSQLTNSYFQRGSSTTNQIWPVKVGKHRALYRPTKLEGGLGIDVFVQLCSTSRVT